MIPITRLGGQEILVNADLIESVETTPDTIITLTTGKKLLVREPAGEITRRVLAFRRAAAGTTLLVRRRRRCCAPGPAAPGQRR